MISCLVAVEKNQGIGCNGSMPWPHLKGDMKWFKEKTINQIVIMGRKTWQSIGSKNLKNRTNIVISSQFLQEPDRCFSSPSKALNFCQTFLPENEIFIIGGSTIYDQFINLIDRFYITEIDHQYECDTYFNLEYVKKNFTIVKEHATFNDPINYTIKEYNK